MPKQGCGPKRSRLVLTRLRRLLGIGYPNTFDIFAQYHILKALWHTHENYLICNQRDMVWAALAC